MHVSGAVAATARAAALAPGLSREYLLHHGVCPHSLAPERGTLVVAATEDAHLDSCSAELSDAYGCALEYQPVTRSELESLIERLCSSADAAIELSRANDGGDESAWNSADDWTSDVRQLASQPPVIRYVNLLVRDAFAASASDIHLEATRSGLSVRFRLDGVLVPAAEPPPSLAHAVVSRIKLLAELDISERRRPQDGRIRVRLEARELDLRVSTIPTVFGESVVLRLLDRGGKPVTLDELGMQPEMLTRLAALARRPHGIVLVTGPTGSGKTTTLYACLQQRHAGVEKIITVEDPVEYQLAGITQMPVHRDTGLGFGSALRSILRQDPDVVMVGEMRDAETAEIAMQAAMTGHLVFSTLHTNDAVSALPRLMDLGVPAYLVSAALEAVVAQRLVRCVCDACRTEYLPQPYAIQRLHARMGSSGDVLDVRFTRGTGCAACRGTGFRGRIGIFELLEMTDELRDMLARAADRAHLRQAIDRDALGSMARDGWSKVRAGITTVEEVLRVVQ